jgi:hypothetical protein
MLRNESRRDYANSEPFVSEGLDRTEKEGFEPSMETFIPITP